MVKGEHRFGRPWRPIDLVRPRIETASSGRGVVGHVWNCDSRRLIYRARMGIIRPNRVNVAPIAASTCPATNPTQFRKDG